MGKILKKLQRWQKDVNNIQMLKNLLPTAIIFDMCHVFSNSKKLTNSNALSLFDLTVKKLADSQSFLYPERYKELVAQNQVLVHGIIFKALYDIYTQYSKRAFENILPYELKTDPQNERIIISFLDYAKLPKCYRGIFTAYDSDNYVLNIPHTNITMAHNKKNRNSLEKLLQRAKLLIPVIYKEGHIQSYTMPAPDAENEQIILESGHEGPAFVSECSSNNYVTDEQLNTICELRDIFIEISKITTPVITKRNKNTSAKAIYEEYLEQLSHTNIFVNATKTLKTAEKHRDTSIDNANKAFEAQKRAAEQSYKEYHSDLIQALSKQIKLNSK